MAADIQFGSGFHKRNPDVLTCIANLSNDEVFTPPAFANQMLDTLAEGWASSNNGENIWSRSDLKFLDPFTKSGVFLREITKRLTQGLENEIPDLDERVDHILTKQVFGLGITELTSQISRRSLYCSKDAIGKHSIATSFKHSDGNVWFEPTQHTWVGGKEKILTADDEGNTIEVAIDGRCKYCGASQKEYDRPAGLETHAYRFIHGSDVHSTIEEVFGLNMQFDVIIGNPPYQLGDGGHAASATPIYQKFIEQAMALEPRFISMVTPSRWFSGGRGLDTFRSMMLKDGRLRVIVDYMREKDAFPNVNINGGVNYFLWCRDDPGSCQITTVAPGGVVGKPISRALDEFDIFIRQNESIEILRKVTAVGEDSFASRVSSLRPFGLRTNFHGAQKESDKAPIKLYGSGSVSWVSAKEIVSNPDWVNSWKVLIPRATDGNENYPLPIWNQNGPFASGPGEACTETYLVAALANDRKQAEHIIRYMRTKFFRFLVSLRKITQDNKADSFAFVPELPMNQTWTDAKLYARYGITEEEIAFIESMIRHMEFEDE